MKLIRILGLIATLCATACGSDGSGSGSGGAGGVTGTPSRGDGGGIASGGAPPTNALAQCVDWQGATMSSRCGPTQQTFVLCPPTMSPPQPACAETELSDTAKGIVWCCDPVLLP